MSYLLDSLCELVVICDRMSCPTWFQYIINLMIRNVEILIQKRINNLRKKYIGRWFFSQIQLHLQNLISRNHCHWKILAGSTSRFSRVLMPKREINVSPPRDSKTLSVDFWLAFCSWPSMQGIGWMRSRGDIRSLHRLISKVLPYLTLCWTYILSGGGSLKILKFASDMSLMIR